MTRILAITWGLSGVLAFIGMPVVRLWPKAAEALAMPLSGVEWTFALAWLAFMVYSEGYRGFQLKFSPRVVARAWYLAAHPVWWHLLLAPAFCVGYFHGTRRRVISSWVLTLAIAGIVMVVRQFPQPWRGLVDLGVIAGLTWGIVAILVFTAQALRDGGLDVDPQVPASATATTAG